MTRLYRCDRCNIEMKSEGKPARYKDRCHMQLYMLDGKTRSLDLCHACESSFVVWVVNSGKKETQS